MNSRVGWMWGLALLLVVGLALAWYVTRGGSDPAAARAESRPAASAEKREAPGQSVLLDAAPSEAGSTRGLDGAREAAPSSSVPEEPARDEAAAESQASPAEEVVVDPVKWEALEPILGGVAAIQARHAGMPYEDRLRRTQQLESAFTTSDLESRTPPESYAALKDELLWLRDNPGTPPARPPKK